MKRFILFIVLVFLFLRSANAHDFDAKRVDAHAPIGVMADHTHKTGEWMFSYRYMKMDMDTFYSGTKEQSVADVHGDFAISPTEMDMEMQMLGAMYAPNDQFTFMAMLPYLTKEMDHIVRSNGRQFSTRTNGIGDVSLSGLYSLQELTGKNVILNFGLSIPTGSINQRDDTPAAIDAKVPYAMQLGSGTFDLLPGLTFSHQLDDWSFGLQALSTVRLGHNEHKYRLGDRFEANGWVAYKTNEWLSLSFRTKYSKWGNIDGADPELVSTMVPTADPNRQGGERLDAFVGFNLLGQDDFFKGHRLAFEIGKPVYRYLEGPQLDHDVQMTVGWQKAF